MRAASQASLALSMVPMTSKSGRRCGLAAGGGGAAAETTGWAGLCGGRGGGWKENKNDTTIHTPCCDTTTAHAASQGCMWKLHVLVQRSVESRQ